LFIIKLGCIKMYRVININIEIIIIFITTKKKPDFERSVRVDLQKHCDQI